jgi:hypothetical protein
MINITWSKKMNNNVNKRNSYGDRSDSDQYELESGYKKYYTNRFKDLSILWGTKKMITSNNFTGGKATSIFGYSEIDLTNCKLDNKSVVIDILGIFGGSTLIVPKEWNVVLDVFSLFSGFSSKIRRTPETKVDMEKTLIIKGFVIFGYGEVKSII